MTIRRGEQWGELVATPHGLVVAADDAELGRLVGEVRDHVGDIPALGVRGGDLARSIGGGTSGRADGSLLRVSVDALHVRADDGSAMWAVAHVVARRSWWRGEVVLAMNAQFHGAFDVAPRSHPNDGRVDVVRVAPSMSARARWQARRRARTGTHVPHPLLSTHASAQFDCTFERPLLVWIDGHKWRRTSALTITVEPDAFVLHA
jgi:hypothetical protein